MRANSSVVERCYFLTFIPQDIDQVRHIYIMAAALDAILLLPTIILNIVLIISLYPQLHKPCTKLLYSLAISDVLVGIVIEPAYLTKKIAELHHCFDIYCYTGMTTYIAGVSLSAISFFNLAAIAVDRYLVVHSGTKYQTRVTNTRVTCVIVAIWVCIIASTVIQLFIPRTSSFQISAALLTVGLIIAAFCYICIYRTLRKSRKKSKTLVTKTTKQMLAKNCRYDRSIFTMLLIFVVFIACYMPFLATSVAAGIMGNSPAIWGAEALSSVIVYSNSLINPIILFGRMKEIRKSASNTVSSTVQSVRHSLHLKTINGIGNTAKKIENKCDVVDTGNQS